jgi:hypothetical protein
MRETSLFLRLWANASSEAYLRANRHGGSCGSQRIRTHDFFSVGDALALRNVVGTITRKRSKDIVNKWKQAEIWAKAKARALNFRQGPARATTRTMEQRGVAREGGRRAQRITSVVRRGPGNVFISTLALLFMYLPYPGLVTLSEKIGQAAPLFFKQLSEIWETRRDTVSLRIRKSQMPLIKHLRP